MQQYFLLIDLRRFKVLVMNDFSFYLLCLSAENMPFCLNYRVDYAFSFLIYTGAGFSAACIN